MTNNTTLTQKYTSANTSVNSKRLPAIYKKINWNLFRGGVVLDIGAGKYTEHIKNYLKAWDITYLPYDPYNLSVADNLYASCRFHEATCVICSNVFNVIREMEVIYDLHKLITSFRVPYFITVYEGDKSWIGTETRKGCWQRNETKDAYVLNHKEIIRGSVITREDYGFYVNK